jgi:hypothetical protein
MKAQLSDILNRLMRSVLVETRGELADALEIKQQSINSALDRGDIPEAWLYKVAYRTRRNVEWLRTGLGPEFQDEAAAEGAEYGRSATVKFLTEAMEHMDEAEQEALKRCVALLAGKGIPREVREHLMQQLELLERVKPAPQRRKKAAMGD